MYIGTIYIYINLHGMLVIYRKYYCVRQCYGKKTQLNPPKSMTIKRNNNNYIYLILYS